MVRITIIKKIKKTGNQKALTFTAEESECYNFEEGQIIKITFEISKAKNMIPTGEN
jgi:ferredoxin-NADP reductase